MTASPFSDIPEDALRRGRYQEHSHAYLTLFAKKYQFEMSTSDPSTVLFRFQQAKHALFLGEIDDRSINYLSDLLRSDHRVITTDQGQAAHLASRVKRKTSVHFDRNQSDYIYLTDHLRRPIGSSYARRRNLISNVRRNLDVCVREMKLNETPTAKSLVQAWYAIRRFTANKDERDACIDAINRASELNLEVFVMEVNGDLEGISIIDPTPRESIIVLFQKCLRGFSRSDEYFYTQLAEKYSDTPYINAGQDLGMTGLKFFKSSMKPYEIRHKWYVQTS
ncbi:phosphatidylglycerol lysyltransferase domain-containing protein [Rhodobacteraceae bacterium DSL-40]|uniref:phosphatidylglycerol lysyltransferase domain-containing protein n=1 Tax=Amaricoccus sp. B4 TaxID=3368557 RepID=UPI000DAB59BB